MVLPKIPTTGVVGQRVAVAAIAHTNGTLASSGPTLLRSKVPSAKDRHIRLASQPFEDGLFRLAKCQKAKKKRAAEHTKRSQ